MSGSGLGMFNIFVCFVLCEQFLQIWSIVKPHTNTDYIYFTPMIS